MTEHGWLDHHDDDPDFHHEPAHLDDQHDIEQPQPTEPDYFDDIGHEHHPQPADENVHDVAYEHHTDTTDEHADLADEAHDAATTEPETVEPETVFPPAVDVGPLPEPVDGFPWIDTGSLGLVDPATAHTDVDPVEAHELAAYAATDLPPGADPWATLADSDDPATAALARWWAENQQ